MEQYQSLLAKLGLKTKIENPACFLEDRNVVVVGSDLARWAAIIRQAATDNARLRRKLCDLDGQLAQRLREVADNLHQSGFSNGEAGHELTRERAKFKRQLERQSRRTAEVGSAYRPPLQAKQRSDAS